MKPSRDRIEYVHKLGTLLRTPMTEDERHEFEAARAAEIARFENRRKPTPQLSLPGVP